MPTLRAVEFGDAVFDTTHASVGTRVGQGLVTCVDNRVSGWSPYGVPHLSRVGDEPAGAASRPEIHLLPTRIWRVTKKRRARGNLAEVAASVQQVVLVAAIGAPCESRLLRNRCRRRLALAVGLDGQVGEYLGSCAILLEQVLPGGRIRRLRTRGVHPRPSRVVRRCVGRGWRSWCRSGSNS